MTQIPDLMSVLSSALAATVWILPSLRPLQSSSQKTSLAVYSHILMGDSCWLLHPVTAAPTITDRWTDLNTERRLVFLRG
jgi:hypothetical protein